MATARESALHTAGSSAFIYTNAPQFAFAFVAVLNVTRHDECAVCLLSPPESRAIAPSRAVSDTTEDREPEIAIAAEESVESRTLVFPSASLGRSTRARQSDPSGPAGFKGCN